jgi:hypothetical protein
VDIYEAIDAMRPGLRGRRWEEVEAAAMAMCRNQVPVGADAIAAVDLGDYRTRLAEGLTGAEQRASSAKAGAIYWEFDLDNDWSSTFFICRSYSPESAGDDGWAADFDESTTIAGPSQSELSRLFATNWNKTAADIGCNIFLIARTLVAFGKAAELVSGTRVPLCAGYHDQDVVFRIHDSP